MAYYRYGLIWHLTNFGKGRSTNSSTRPFVERKVLVMVNIYNDLVMIGWIFGEIWAIVSFYKCLNISIRLCRKILLPSHTDAYPSDASFCQISRMVSHALSKYGQQCTYLKMVLPFKWSRISLSLYVDSVC